MSLVETSFGKLLSDTLHAIQKDVLKIAILAIASLTYRAVKDVLKSTEVRQALMRGQPVFLVLLLVAAALRAKRHNDDELPVGEARSQSPIGYVKAHPLGISATLLSVVVIDRLEMFSAIGRVLTRFGAIAGPRLYNFFLLGASRTAPRVAPLHVTLLRRVLRWLIPTTLIMQAIRLQASWHAAAMLEAQRLLEAQKLPIQRWCNRLWHSRQQWLPGVQTLGKVSSAFFGTASAVKYLLARGVR